MAKKNRKSRSNAWEFYFAFGSNLNVEQMRARCPTSIVVSTARLDDWRLAFAGSSSLWEGHGVATIEEHPGASVPGVLYLVSRSDLARLDRWEGHPRAYVRQPVDVDIGDVVIRVWTYVKHGARLTRPCDEYLRAIAEGYAMIDADAEHWQRLTVAADAPAPLPPAPPAPPVQASRPRALVRTRGLVAGARRALSADEVPSNGGGLRRMVRAAFDAETAPQPAREASERVRVYAYPGGRFDADRFADDVRDALLDAGRSSDANGFCLDVGITGAFEEDELIDLASRYVDVDTWGSDDDGVPAWWFDEADRW